MKLSLLYCFLTFALILNSMEQSVGPQWNAKQYSDHSNPQKQVALKILDTLDVIKYQLILDVGCGSGDITAIIAKRAAKTSKVIGIDSSLDMIKCAQNSFWQPHLSFMQADVTTLELEKKADLVVSFACLHWCKDQAKALERIYACMSNPGKLVISMAGKQKEHPLKKSLAVMSQSDDWKSVLAPIDLENEVFPQDKESIETLLRQIGFKKIMVLVEERNRRFINDTALKQWLNAWLVGLPSIATLIKQKPAFLDDLVKAYKKVIQVNSDGSVEYTVSGLIAQAFKV